MTSTRSLLLASAMAMALLVPGSARAECPASAQQVAIEGDAVFASYEARDLEGVHLHASAVRRAMDCLQDRLSAQQAASAHVAMALSSFLNRDMEITEAAFRAALRADPDVALPAGVPEGHPLQQAFASAQGESSYVPTETMRSDPAYELVIDGSTTTARPTSLPAVLQAVDGNASKYSTYLLPSGSLPDWASLGGSATVASTDPTNTDPTSTDPTSTDPTNTDLPAADDESTADDQPDTSLAGAETVVEPAKQARKKKKRKGPSPGLLVASGGMALVSGGLWTAAYLDGSNYIDNKTTAENEVFADQGELDDAQAELDAQHLRVNSIGYAAQGTAALTGVLLVASFVF